MAQGVFKLFLLWLSVVLIMAESEQKDINSNGNELSSRTDLEASPTSAKLFNLGSLLGQNPNYPNGYGNYYPRPYYTTGSGYYPNTGSGYYPNTGSGYYPNTGSGYYPSTGGYYPSTSSWTGNNYPNYGYYGNTGSSYPNSGGYYPTTSGGYYPSGGTNILGGTGGYGGYGGYGGNGGLRQYYGYWNPEYSGQRNRGYGYFTDTDRFGLPRNWRGGNDNNPNSYGRERDRVPGAYRGYD